ncbi:SOS response-associated peptidase [Halomonas sp. HP20-15]|uniref:SOS response-associated peptidase n=1 Tax=Halomonas sp. HP20-15 TaxID=3085901 RepID=UPI002981F64F|nr:SOS response-associated peptidase [Halomonas sp. HP20-15]MDW5378594.1 SOS response-associated peptidase [Halomonas sp. HP20-15]
MCGRFALYSPYAKLAQRLGVPLVEQDMPARYNVAPGTWVVGIRRLSADKPAVMDALWWGYKPHWAGEKAPEPINATVEKVATSSYYKGAFAHRRCLIPADGWYEWLKQPGGKQPYFFCRRDREPIWFAGIWVERADGKPGCAILTEPARGFTKDIHSRMPLVLDDESLEPWLDPDLTDRESIRHLIRHLPVDALTSWAVSQRVGSPKNEGEVLINPA